MEKREGCGEETLKPANNYLTTADSPALEVWGMIKDLGFKIELDSQEPVAKLVPLSLVISPSTYDDKYNF